MQVRELLRAAAGVYLDTPRQTGAKREVRLHTLCCQRLAYIIASVNVLNTNATPAAAKDRGTPAALLWRILRPGYGRQQTPRMQLAQLSSLCGRRFTVTTLRCLQMRF